MEECGILVHKLGKILDTIKKNPNRKFKLNTLRKKQDDAKDIYNRILQLTQTIKIDECTILLKASRNIYEEVKTLLNAKLILPKLISFKTISLIVLNCIRSYSKNKKIKMTTAVEIIKTLPLLIPQYSGEGDKLNSIIAALNASKVLITNDNRAVALQVILSRFEGKARSAVGDNPASVDVIIEKLKEKCKVTVAPETVVAKLNATKQNGEISKFTEQIEKLTLELERAYISEDVPVETASRMAVKAGVKALASGVKNNETRLLLKAGQFSTLSSAVEKLTENEPTNVNLVVYYHIAHNISEITQTIILVTRIITIGTEEMETSKIDEMMDTIKDHIKTQTEAITEITTITVVILEEITIIMGEITTIKTGLDRDDKFSMLKRKTCQSPSKYLLGVSKLHNNPSNNSNHNRNDKLHPFLTNRDSKWNF